MIRLINDYMEMFCEQQYGIFVSKTVDFKVNKSDLLMRQVILEKDIISVPVCDVI